MAKSKKMILTYTPEVTPAPTPEGETPSGIRVNWKAKSERLEAECVRLGQSLAAVTDQSRMLMTKMAITKNMVDHHLNRIDSLEMQNKIHESEISRLETVIGERANTIERLTVGIDQYHKDIAVHVATADDRSAYVAELQNDLIRISRELKAMTVVRDDLRNRLDSAFDRFDRIPRWIRNLFGAA